MLFFSMIWLMEILIVYQGKQRLIKYYLIKHLTMLKIQTMADIKEIWLQCNGVARSFFDKAHIYTHRFTS